MKKEGGFFIVFVICIININILIVGGQTVEKCFIGNGQEVMDLANSNNLDAKKLILATTSNEGNSHISLFDRNLNIDVNQNYLYCNFPGINTCNDNKVLGISQTINAHVESPGNNNYADILCFADLECVVGAENTCTNERPIQLVSLSDLTNAHISEFGSYDYNICCKHKTQVPPPTKNIYWANTDFNLTQAIIVVEKTNVYMVFTPNLNQGDIANYEIYERDILTSNDFIAKGSYIYTAEDETRGYALKTWATFHQYDDPGASSEYFFKVKYTKNNNLIELISDDLIVNQALLISRTCESGIDYSRWVDSVGTVEEVTNEAKNCLDVNANPSYCCPTEQVCNIETRICEKPSSEINSCEDYNNVDENYNAWAGSKQKTCENDPENIVDISVSLLRSDGKNCLPGNEIVEENPLTFLSDCACTWRLNNSGTCETTYNENTENTQGIIHKGLCRIISSEKSECIEGNIEYKWNSEWFWIEDEDNPSYGSLSDIPGGENSADYTCVGTGQTKCYFDPIKNNGKRLSESCLPGIKKIPCVGMAKLPFFDNFNLLITAILIVLGYLTLIKRMR